MGNPVPLIFNLGPQEWLLLILGCCGFLGIAGASGAILTYFLLRQSKSKKE